MSKDLGTLSPAPGESPKLRKPSTPQLDRVVDAIERGDYDEKIIELHRALAARQDVLKAQVLAQVRQVFGADAEIVSSGSPVTQPEPDNPFVKKAERDGSAIRPSPPPPVASATADQIDEDRITKDPLETVQTDAGLSISEVERRMMSGEQIAELENRGPIISGFSASQMGGP